MSNPITECNTGHMSIPKFRGRSEPIRTRGTECYNPRDKISRDGVWLEFWVLLQKSSFPTKVKKAELPELQSDFKIIHSVISYLISVDWNSIRLSGFLLWPQYLCAADEGADFLSLGPLAILHQVKGLAHLYSTAPRTFIYFKDRKMRYFWGNGQPLGPTTMIERD